MSGIDFQAEKLDDRQQNSVLDAPGSIPSDLMSTGGRGAEVGLLDLRHEVEVCDPELLTGGSKGQKPGEVARKIYNDLV